ncbi:YfjI family protein [Accumulibacter sp.]|uniref:YfjI family protein n=1 Tax=Accumulibacter sp. TaxID=2053492 RepID=UPI00263490E8|nr:YfjI family protein [Accumulibacter sp.]
MKEAEKINAAATQQTDTLDRVLRYAVQKGGVRSNQIELAETRWGALVERFAQMQAASRTADLDAVPALVYAEFNPEGTRRDVDVLAITALVLDIDKGANLDRTRSALAGRECAIYTTKRSTPTAPRLRAVLPLAAPVSARDWPGTYRQFAAALALPGLDACAEKLSQPFFAPPGGGHFEHMTGEWLDPAPYIAAARQAEYDALPEPEPIRIALLPVPALDPELIPVAFRGWIADTAHRMQCPIDFCAVGAIGILAAVVGAGIGIKPKRKDDWLIVPNLWGGVIGPPSKKKTPALAEMVKALGRLEKLATDGTRQAKATAADPETKAIQKLLDAELKEAITADRLAKRTASMATAYADATNGDMPSEEGSDNDATPPAKRKTPSRQPRLSPPTRSVAEIKLEMASLSAPPPGNLQERFRTNDATIEALHDLLSTNRRGILVFRDELVGLLRGWDKQGREQDRGFYLEAWNGQGNFPLDRIGRGHVICDNMCVSILGGTQPDKVRNYLYQARIENDGMMQRFQLLTYPDVQPFVHIVDEYPDGPARERAFAIIETLARTDFERVTTSGPYDQTPCLRFADDGAQNLFIEWYERLHREKLEDPDEAPLIVEYLSKQPKTMASLALLFHLVDRAEAIAAGESVGPVSLQAAARAADWCSYLEAHARRIYGLSANLQSQAAAALAERIGKGQLDELGSGAGFTARDIYRKQWSLLDDREIVDEALGELVEASWLLQSVQAAGFQRRGHVRYRVNPKARQRNGLGADNG